MNLSDLSAKFQLAGEKIRAAKQILIIGHTSPDADAIASIGAMIEVASSLGVQSYAYADRKRANNYDYIAHEELIKSEPPDDLRVFDIILVLD